MIISKTTKRIGNYLAVSFLAICCITVGISMIITSNLHLKDVDSFTGTVTEKGISAKNSNVSGKANMTQDIFYLKLQGLDQVLGVYNPKKDYGKLEQTINIGDELKVYFKRSYRSNEININTFQIEKNGKIILNKDDYQFREKVAGYLAIVGGIIMIGVVLYQDNKKYWRKLTTTNSGLKQ